MHSSDCSHLVERVELDVDHPLPYCRQAVLQHVQGEVPRRRVLEVRHERPHRRRRSLQLARERGVVGLLFEVDVLPFHSNVQVHA